MTKILPLLKQRTQTAHLALEQHYPFSQIMQRDVSPLAYAQALQVLHITHSWLEPLFTQRLPAALLQEIGFRSHITSLEADLRELASPHLHAVVHPVLNDSELLGALYVITGSFLGAKIIQRHLALETDFPCNFYTEAAQSSASWPAFRQAFEQHCQTATTNHDAVIDGANTVFNFLISQAQLQSNLYEAQTA